MRTFDGHLETFTLTKLGIDKFTELSGIFKTDTGRRIRIKARGEGALKLAEISLNDCRMCISVKTDGFITEVRHSDLVS